jgi:hypothetical protein
MPVMSSRSKASTSASIACASTLARRCATPQSSGSAKVPVSESRKRLVSVTAYHSFGGEVEAFELPHDRTLPLHAVTNFRP